MVFSREVMAAARAADGSTRLTSLEEAPEVGGEVVDGTDVATAVVPWLVPGRAGCAEMEAKTPNEEATIMAAISTTIPACMSGFESLIGP
jgi:hypothetical protein